MPFWRACSIYGEKMTLLEVCCYSMECALEAQRRGTDRIELCAAPQEG